MWDDGESENGKMQLESWENNTSVVQSENERGGFQWKKYGLVWASIGISDLLFFLSFFSPQCHYFEFSVFLPLSC